jgi:hypothetical protein
MDGLEEQLKRALARQDPSAGFADRITAAARPGAGPGLRAVPAAPFAPRWWLATAAMALVTVGSGVAYRRHQGELAKEQVMTAMRLTAVKLQHIQAHVREARP